MQPELVFIHGMWCRGNVWEAWIGEFERAGYICHRLDLPGHQAGGDERQLCGLGLDDYVAAILEAIRGLDRPVLIGHSLGGLLGQLVAPRAELAGLVMVNSAAPAQIFPIRAVMLPGLVRHFSRWGLWRGTLRLSRWEADYLVFNQVPGGQRAALFGLLGAESGRVLYQVGFGVLNRARSNRVERDSLNCPLLLHAGAKDRIIPVAVSRKMAAWYGQRLSYREWPGRGYWLLGEPGWQEVIRQTLDWLAANGGRPGGRITGAAGGIGHTAS